MKTSTLICVLLVATLFVVTSLADDDLAGGNFLLTLFFKKHVENITLRIFTDRSKAVLRLWIAFVGYASCWCLFFAAFWSPAGKGLTTWLSCVLCFVTFPNVSWSTSESRVRLAPLNWFKPSSKIFYGPFQGGTSFVDLLCFCSVLCLLCLCARLFICALWSPAEKGLTSWLSFVVSTVSLSLSHWYPGSGVVLDCIDS